MLQSFTIKNFRCLTDLKVERLARINLIAGKNNAGKTSLLESLFLHLGPPLSHSRHFFDFLRTLERFSINDQEYWEWLFPNKRPDLKIEIGSVAATGINRRLRIRLAEPQVFTLPRTDQGGPLAELSGRFELDLDYEETLAGEKRQVGYVISPLGTISRTGVSQAPVQSISCVYLGASALQTADDTERFGELERAGRQKELVDILKLLEPRLTRLATIVSAGETTLRGDIGIGDMVPVRLMGEGVRRLLSVLLAIAAARGGICLIDEVENGFHHSVVKEVWKAIARMARTADVQVFATTHSWEYLVKAHEAFTEGECYDLLWHRLQWVRGELQVVSHDQEMIDVALYSGVEIR